MGALAKPEPRPFPAVNGLPQLVWQFGLADHFSEWVREHCETDVRRVDPDICT